MSINCTPATTTAGCSLCFMTLGVFILVAGVIIRSISLVENYHHYDPFYREPRDDLYSTPILVSTVLMSIGGGFIGLSIVLMIVSFIVYRLQVINHNRERHQVRHEQSQQTNSLNHKENASNEKLMDNVPVPKGDINTVGLPNANCHLASSGHHVIGFSYTAGCLPTAYTYLNISRSLDSKKESCI